nr:DUF523 and DUF1722 domain-containing protein [candidate division Zixibacteria bacterium]
MVSAGKSVSSIRIGISACLLGQKVRFDGGHKQNHYLTDILGEYFHFVPVCPEVEVGMSVPREAVQLEGSPDNPRMIGIKSRRDWTDRMNRFAAKWTKKLKRENLSGYILKKNSPSCGMERVKVFSKSIPARTGRGLYAAALIRHSPLLPVEEEGRLNDPALRENFIVRVFAYARLNQLFDDRFSRRSVIDFHTNHKYLLLAHSPKHYREMGQLVARIKDLPPTEFRDRYSRLFMDNLGVKTTIKKNVNVLMHILGFLKNKITSDDKQSILSVIEDYHRALVPLVVPLTLIKHYVLKHNIEYIKDQIYLNPHPKELMLRNHV